MCLYTDPRGGDFLPWTLCVSPTTLPTYELETLIKLALGFEGKAWRRRHPGLRASAAGHAGRPERPGLRSPDSGEEPPGPRHRQRRAEAPALPSVTNLLEGCWQFSLVFHHLLFLIIVRNPCIGPTCFSSNLVGPVVPSHC